MKKFEKVNQSNIFLYHVIEKLIFLQIHNILENPQISNMNSDFTSETTVRNIEIPSSIFVVSEQVLDASA